MSYKVLTITDPKRIAEQLAQWLDEPQPCEVVNDPYDIDPYDSEVDRKLLGDE